MNEKQNIRNRIGLIIAFCLIPVLAFSHDRGDVAGGLLSGFLHPVTGLDHVVAMVAVGLWGAQLGGKSIWVLPVVFPMLMAFGGSLGVSGIAVPGVEIFIALSGIVLGFLVAMQIRVKMAYAIFIVAFFAVFHGYAHGVELPNSAEPLAYGLGFVITTGLLHLTGILIGTLYKFKMGRIIVRSLGACVALVGTYYLIVAL
jgi:urease accessory protein